MTDSSDARRKEIDEVFGAALSIDSENREAFLDERCTDDELRKEVERLLRAVDRADRLRTGGGVDLAIDSGAIPERDEQDAHEGQLIRGYRLLQEIGAGGMGEVWKAEQTEPVRRMVALKLLRRGMDSKEVVARFESERQALAIMTHPSIARVFDGGVSETGRPFFVMELVRGTPITSYCDENRLTTPERLGLFQQVCEGVQHAHHKGIIHRDIKPSNVLVTTETGPPVPKIIDFGVARAVDQRLSDRPHHTKIGSIIGTPGYMSPEQFEMGTIDVDTRADVYSLGVLLYEILTSLPPFEWGDTDEVSFDELRRRIREHEPTRPSTRVAKERDSSADIAKSHRVQPAALAAELEGDLDWIVLKALEKDRTARYDSPHELAEDIRRHLHDQPVLAGPPSARYRLAKFARRNRMPLAAAGAVLFGLVGAGVGLTYALVESNHQRARAEAALAAAQAARAESDAARAESEAVADFLADMIQAAGPRHEGRDVTVREAVDRAAHTIDQRFSDDSLVGARLRMTMGRVYEGLGFYEEAKPLLEQSVATVTEQLGADSPDLADYVRALADLYSRTGDVDEARRLYEQVVGIQEAAHGTESMIVASTLVNYSAMLADFGEHAEAARLLERSLAIQQASAGADNPHVLTLLNNVAVQLVAAGDITGAREYCERALEAVQATQRPDHPWNLTIRGNIADLMMQEGRIDTALALQQEVLAERERVLGEDHPHVAISLTSLAENHLLHGDPPGAMRLADRALGIREMRLGSDHPSLVSALRVRAEALEKMGHPELARTDLERAVRILERRNDRGSRKELDACVELLVELLRRTGADAEADRVAARHAARSAPARSPD